MLAQRHNQGQHHAEPGVDGPRDEVGREDCGVPAGELRDREVQRHRAMHGQHQRCGQAGQDEIGLLVVAPVAVGAGPAQGEQAVDKLPCFGPGPVAENRQVRDQPDVPEEERHGKIGGDGEHVPHQRRAELGPDAVRVRQREQPPRKPHAPDMDDGVNSGAHHREDGHRLRRAVNRSAPALAQQEKDRRDERSGVADADPPDEVDDRPPPHDRMVQAPNAHSRRNEVADHRHQHREQHHAGNEGPPPPRGRLTLDDAGNFVSDPTG